MPHFQLPDKFEDGDLEKFKKSFERVAAANGWTPERQLAALSVALSGRALLAFEKEEAKFKTLTDAFDHLKAVFNSARDQDSSMKEFYNSEWGVGVDPEVYANRLMTLLKKSIPSLDADDADRLAVKQFIVGFPVEFADKLRPLFAGKRPNLDEVVEAARDLLRGPKAAQALIMFCDVDVFPAAVLMFCELVH